MEINVLIHGNSEGFKSDFMQSIFDGLTSSEMECYGFDFDYIIKSSEPSLGLKDELGKLRVIIKDLEGKGYNKINLIGKSIGGTLCLEDAIVNDRNINKIFIVGFPYKLGYPADLALLKTKPVIERDSAKEDYTKLFSKIKKNFNKIIIIQGENDLLGSRENIDNLFSQFRENINIFFLKNSSHGFKPISEITTLDENMDKIVRIIKESI